MDNLTNELERFVYRIAAEIKNEAQMEAPTITRNLRNDIKVYEKGRLQFEVGNSKLASYAPYVHQGTGIYGPKKTRIRPKRAKALKIPTKKGVIYRKSSKGQKPNPYFERALDNYVSKGSFDRAVNAQKSAIVRQIGKDLKEKLPKNVSIKIL
jgi:HK97 gp10 family phage protein